MPAKAPDGPSQGIPGRLFRAVRAFEAETGEKLEDAVLGDAVAAEIGFAKPFAESTVRGWKNRGTAEIDVVWGIARALGVSFAWLAVGEGEMRTAGAAPRTRPERRFSAPPEPVDAERGLAAARELKERAGKQQRPAVKGGAKRRRPGAG